MTDRFKGFVVVLERDTRDDDAAATINAIRCIRGVLSVEPQLATMEDVFAESRVRAELGRKLLDIIYPKRNTDG